MSAHNFTHDMLPQLGVRWHWFPTLKDAEAFEKWVKRETKYWCHPCEVLISEVDDRPAHERFEVRVKNW